MNKECEIAGEPILSNEELAKRGITVHEKQPQIELKDGSSGYKVTGSGWTANGVPITEVLEALEIHKFLKEEPDVKAVLEAHKNARSKFRDVEIKINVKPNEAAKSWIENNSKSIKETPLQRVANTSKTKLLKNMTPEELKNELSFAPGKTVRWDKKKPESVSDHARQAISDKKQVLIEELEEARRYLYYEIEKLRG